MPASEKPRHLAGYFAFLLLATVLTWLVGFQDSRYVAVDTDGFGEVFPLQLQRWTVHGDSPLPGGATPELILPESASKGSGATLLLELPAMTDLNDYLLRIRTVAKTLQRPSSSDMRTDAVIGLQQLDIDGQIIRRSRISRLTGEFHTHRDEHLTDIDADSRSIRIRMANRQSDGSFSLQQVNVDIVRKSALYAGVLLPLLLLMWVSLIVVSLVYASKRLGRKRLLMVFITLLILAAGILLPGGLRDIAITPLFDQLKAAGLIAENLRMEHYYKSGHFLAFFIISYILLSSASRLQLNSLDVFVLMIILAIATEGAQLHLFYRSSKPADIVIDIAGVTAALLLHRAIRFVAETSAKNSLPDR